MQISIDLIVIIILAFYFIIGWNKGFLKTIFSPFALLLGCLISIKYYQTTGNLLVSLAISLVGPFILNLLFSLIIKLFQKATDKEPPAFSLGRLAGGVLNFFWGAGIVLLTIILITLIPVKISSVDKIQKDIITSKTYQLTDQLLGKKLSQQQLGLKNVTEVLQNPANHKLLESTAEFQKIMSDESIKKLLSDEETVEQIKNKDYAKILANPQIQEILKNKELLQAFLSLNQKLMNETGVKSNEEPTKSAPKYYINK